MLRPGLFASVALLLASSAALAFQIEDPLHSSCHERISAAALDAAGYVGTPPDATEEERGLLASADFDLEQYGENPWVWSLIVGVRFPDLRGAPSFDFDDLSRVHNALDDQDAHCLRSESQDGPLGDEQAVIACRNVIESLYWEALSSLDSAGSLDPGVKTTAALNLTYSGRVDYPVSELYFAAGRALHAIQDSFTHTYRDPDDWRSILTVFNWSDQVSCVITEERDGHGHEGLLDDCEDEHPSNLPRMGAAQEASTRFMALFAEPGTRDERAERLRLFLDEWFAYRPGCEFANDYCDHPEQAFLVSSPDSDIAICESDGCASMNPSSTSLGACALLVLGVLSARRRRARSALVAAALMLSVPALADEPPAAPSSEPAPSSVAPPAVSPDAAPPAVDAAPADAAPTAATPPAPASRSGYRTEVRTSMSLQNPAAAVGVAAGYRLGRFDVGAFVEMNPWYSFERNRIHLGSTNLGGFFHYLHPIGPDAELRVGAGLGAAVLNESLAGSPAGKFGPYLNLRLLGVTYHWEDVAFTVDGFDLALPVPQMTGWPVLHAQHRISVGLQF